MSESIRIRTTPNGSDQYLKVKIEQDFDFIEVLSLKISQDKAYENFCSDYGVIVGRVVINSGFGIPNAKVSVFIPIDEDDKKDPHIRGLYPYETVNDKDSEGVRYNLLPKEVDAQDDCYTPIGTFPAKREILDNDDMLYVYCKYYKFTSVTNYAGDFMIFGVPLGPHTIHVDADISDIGIASQRPYDLIDQGTPSKMFYSPTKFKASKNINSTIQIKSANIGVNVQPFWGDVDTCQIGINRADVDLNYTIRPAAIFMGSIFGDSRKNSLSKRCRPRKRLGRLCQQITREGTIEMIRKDKDNLIERFDIEGGRLIDDSGAWAYQIPCNLDYVVTDEFGRTIPSEDESKGVPTRTRARFRISMDEGGNIGRLRTRGKYLVPHNPATPSDMDFSFDKSTKDMHFEDFYWNKIYTVKNFIARTQKPGARVRTKDYTGIKDVDACVGDKNPFPFNRTYTRNNVLFTIICFIVTLIGFIVKIINIFLCWLKGIGIGRPINWYPFGGLNAISMKCIIDDEEKYYNVGCDDSLESYTDCVSIGLAVQLDMFEFDFYNDWVNGTLYYYLLKYKKRRRSGREKFCETYCNDFPNQGGTGTNPCKNIEMCDTTVVSLTDAYTAGFRNGMLVKYDNNLYYPPLVLDGQSASGFKLFPTGIISLGAVFDCDWQGFPKIIQYMTNTSYKIPPLAEEVDAEDGTIVTGMIECGGNAGWYGQFFDINCKGLSAGSDRLTNIRRLCELQVDNSESDPGGQIHQTVNIQNIYSTGPFTPPDSQQIEIETNLNKYVRDSFCLLNINGPSISAYPPSGWPVLDNPANANSVGTSFGINGINTEDHLAGTTYLAFRKYFRQLNGPDVAFQAHGNSFFMYFGIIPGATALNKLNAKYFTPCIRVKSDDFIIDTTVASTTTNSSADGSITLTFLGGTTPFIYTVTNFSTIALGPYSATTSGPFVIPNLTPGTYQIAATDALGTTVIKDVEVTGPPGLTCSFSPSVEPCTPTSPSGEVAAFLIGGKPPYTLTYINNTRGTTNTINNATSGPISGLYDGSYTFTVTDSASPQETCSSTLMLDAPPPIYTLIKPKKDGYNDISCGATNDGYIKLYISGGTSPYTVTTTGPNGFNTGDVNYQDVNLKDLYDGTYTITIKDSGLGSCQQVKVITQVLLKLVPPSLTLNNTNNQKQCDPNKYTIQFNIIAGTAPPPYTIYYNVDGTDNPVTTNSTGLQTIYIFQQIFAYARITIEDSNNCTSNELFLIEPNIHRPSSILSLSGSRNINQLITWSAAGDSYFAPYMYTPVNTPGGNTFQSSIGVSQLGSVSNRVGCTASATA